MRKQIARDRGVTLVEMMVVVVILGILAGVSTLIITTIFNSNIQGGQMLQQQSTVQTADNYLVSRLTPVNEGGIGQTTSAGTSISPVSIAGDQFTFVNDGLCYREIFLAKANAIDSVTQPVDPSTGKCQTGTGGISPVLGPTASNVSTDPVLNALDLTTGGIKSGASLPTGSHAFVLASNVQAVDANAPVFSFCDANCSQTLPVDAAASATSTSSWYSNPANLKTVASVKVNANVLGSRPGSNISIAPRLFAQQFFLGSQDAGGQAASASASTSSFNARLATTGRLPDNTLSAGTLTANDPGALQVDGAAVKTGDRILVTSEKNAAKNGIYDVVDPGSNGGGTPVTIKDTLASLPVRDAFNRSDLTMPNWAKTSWASGTGTTAGNSWYSAASPSVVGAYWTPSTYAESGTATGVAASLTLKTIYCQSKGDYMSVWLDMPAPASGQSGYMARIICDGTGATSTTFDVEIDKYVAGTKTALVTVPNQTITNGTAIALVAVNGTLRVFTNDGSGYSFLDGASASDSTFTSGYTGIGAQGAVQAVNFAAGTIQTVTPTGASPWKLTRSTGASSTADYQSDGDFPPGSLVTVSQGTQNANSIWQLQPLSPSAGWTLNSSPQTFKLQAGNNAVGTPNIQNGAITAAKLDYPAQPVQACASRDTMNVGTADMVWLTTCNTPMPSGVTLNTAGWCPPQSGGNCGGTFIQMDSTYIKSPGEMLMITTNFDMALTGGGCLIGYPQTSGQIFGTAAVACGAAGTRTMDSTTNIYPAWYFGGPNVYNVGMNVTGNVANNVATTQSSITVVPLPY